jgi:formylglycine-generating enzyme required for sulfatase activity
MHPAWAARSDRDGFGVFAELVLDQGVSARLRWIPPGSFLMGASAAEFDRWDDEGPQHEVTLSKGLWLADTPCTQAQWQAVMKTSPSRFAGANRPVERVSWSLCQQFCVRLRERDPRLVARLPTEAEWEYACRAETTGAFNDGSLPLDEESQAAALLPLGWFEQNSDGESHPVAQLRPNRWGLYDMHGNVWEWCQDQERKYSAESCMDPIGTTESQTYAVRGGGWHYPATQCRSAFRFGLLPFMGYHALGFRFAIEA